MVPDVAKQFFPQMAVGFDDPRVQVHITDGIKYVQEAAEDSFDVIIVDSSDPVGPAEVLFQKVILKLASTHDATAPCSHDVMTFCLLSQYARCQVEVPYLADIVCSEFQDKADSLVHCSRSLKQCTGQCVQEEWSAPRYASSACFSSQPAVSHQNGPPATMPMMMHGCFQHSLKSSTVLIMIWRTAAHS